MLSKKTKRRFVWLGIASLLMWLYGTFGLIVLDYFKKGGGFFGLAVETKAAVPLSEYQAALATVHMLLFDSLPAIASGYLLLALFIFYFVEKDKKDDEKPNHDA
jgi:hypothetical protein